MEAVPEAWPVSVTLPTVRNVDAGTAAPVLVRRRSVRVSGPAAAGATRTKAGLVVKLVLMAGLPDGETPPAAVQLMPSILNVLLTAPGANESAFPVVLSTTAAPSLY